MTTAFSSANNEVREIEVVNKTTGEITSVDFESIENALALVERNAFKRVAQIDCEIVSMKPSESVQGVYCGIVNLEGQWGPYKAVKLLMNAKGVPKFVLIPGIQLVGQIEKLPLIVNKTPIEIEGVSFEQGENGRYLKHAIYLLKGE
jgi:hypothetical protein